MKPHLVIAVLAPLCGSSIPMGFNLAVLNSPQKHIRTWIKQCLQEQYNRELTTNQEVMSWSAVVSVFLVGAMLGSLNCSSIADKIGRKRTLLLSHVICIIASLSFTLSVYLNFIEIFIIGRFLAGICGGIASSIVPLYFSEIFPNELKGVSGIIHVSGMTFGILLSIIIGIDAVLGSEPLWRFLSCVTLVGSGLALLSHPLIVEAPLFSLLKKNMEQAHNTLQKLRNDHQIVKCEIIQLNNLKANLSSETAEREKVDIKTIAKTPGFKILLLNVIILFGIQQLSGINGCWYYSNMIFTLAGLSPWMSSLASIFASSTNWIMGFVSFLITRKYPRRKLLITSVIGCALSLSIMSISLYFAEEHKVNPYITLLSFIMFIIFFGSGVGVLPFILTVEMMPERYRSVALSLGASVMWTCNLIVSLSLPLLNHHIGSFIFLIFASFLLLSGTYFYFFIPETFKKSNNNEANEINISVVSRNALDLEP